jgi:hypothetical protein
MNFWRVGIGPCFQKSFWNDFFLFVKKIMLKKYIIEISIWTFTLMDFMSFFLNDFQNDFTILINNNTF